MSPTDAPVPLNGDVTVERLSLGVAARLSRYLQVLTQARKMGKETISSHELSDYTHINSTQIRRDLSGFGKFGKRGVGYNVDSLVSQIRRILRTAGQHNIALFGAGHLGQAIASSDIFADHGFNVVAIFDADTRKVGSSVGGQKVRDIADLPQVVEDEGIVVGVLAVPTVAAQPLADELVGAGVRILFNYSDALLQVPAGVTVEGMGRASVLTGQLTLGAGAVARALAVIRDEDDAGDVIGVTTEGAAAAYLHETVVEATNATGNGYAVAAGGNSLYVYGGSLWGSTAPIKE